MTFKQTVLQELFTLIRQEGLSHLTEQQILSRIDISSATFREFFSSMEDMVTQVVSFDLENRKAEHERLFAAEPSPVRQLLSMVQMGLESLQESKPSLLMEIQQSYPGAWSVYWNHSNDYTAHTLYEILNEGILKHELRRDLNLQLVTKIMLEQLSMLVNPAIFPPDKYNISEAFRSIFLYYIRGICAEEGMKKVEDFFSTLK